MTRNQLGLRQMIQILMGHEVWRWRFQLELGKALTDALHALDRWHYTG